MGNSSAKLSPTLDQPYHNFSEVAPSEPVTLPKTIQRQEMCRLTQPIKGHEEWDECMRQSVQAIGTTTIIAIAAGLMVPAAGTLLLLGTGTGVLWSVKRCRTIMRDGLLNPEQAKALEHRKKVERDEKRNQRRMEREAKQRAEAERRFREKQKHAGKNECCTKLKKILEQEAQNKGAAKMDKVLHSYEKSQNIKENVQPMVSPNEATPQVHNLQHDPTMISSPENNDKTTKPEPVKQYKKQSDMYSLVKLFAPYSQNSESVILTCSKNECICHLNKDDYIIEQDFQQYTQPSHTEDDPQNEEMADLVTHEINIISEDQDEMLEVEILSQDASVEDSLDLNTYPQHPEQDLPQDPEDDSIEVEVTSLPNTVFDEIEPLNNDIFEFNLEDNGDMEVEITEPDNDLEVEITQNDYENEQAEQPRGKMEVNFEENEGWPFSFSLPSLDKFTKKKDNSFKWPPLTSSIIVKPKKEKTCQCSDGSTDKDKRKSP